MDGVYKAKGKKYFRVTMTPDIEVSKKVTEAQVYAELEQLLSNHKGLIQFYKIGFVEIEETDGIEEDR